MDETDTDSEIDFGEGCSSWFKDQEEPIALREIAVNPVEIEEENDMNDLIEIIEDPLQKKTKPVTPIEIKEDPLENDLNVLIEIIEKPSQKELNPVTPIEIKDDALENDLNILIDLIENPLPKKVNPVTLIEIKVDQLENDLNDLIEIVEEPIQKNLKPVTPIEIKEDSLENDLNILIDIKEEPLQKNLNFETRIELKKELLEKYFNAFVYTTRLDDMGVLKTDLFKANKGEVTNSILLESKPTLTKAPQDSSRVKKSLLVNLRKFNDVKEKLGEFYNKRQDICEYNSCNPNTITDRRSHDPNEKLLKLCRPLSIVLQDISTVSLAQPKEKQLKINKNSGQNIKNGTHFLLQDYYSEELNIYTIDSSGHLTGYYNSKGIIEKYAFLSSTNFNIITISYCCWYQREQRIQKLVPDIVPKVTANIMRTTHKCLSKCLCCCRETKSKNIVVSTPLSLDVDPSVDDEINEIKELDRQISEALSKLKGKNEDRAISEEIDTKHPITLIDKALKYKRKLKNDSLEENPIPKTSDKLYTVTVKHAKKDESELYQFRADGSAVTYIKSYDSYTGGQFRAFVCCWNAREQEIEKMHIQLKSQQFLKTSHSCPPESCVCCCKRRTDIDKLTRQKNTSSVSVKHLPNVSSFDGLGGKLATLSKRKTNAPNSSSKVKANRFKKQEQKIKIGEKKCDSNLVNVRLTPYNSLVTNSLQTEPVFESVIENNIGGISANSFNETTNTASVNNMYIPTETELHNTNAPVTIEETNSGTEIKDDRVSGTLNVDMLITTILDRFKDVRLTINEDGKVAASINTPMNTLTTAELKVLANILAHAQEQVTSLNLAPGSNINKHMEMLNNLSNDVTTNNSTRLKPVTFPPTNTCTSQQENMSTLSGYLDATKLSLEIQVPESFTSNFGKPTVPLNTSSSTQTSNTVRDRSGTDEQLCSDKIKLYQSFSKVALLKKQYHCNSFQTYCKSISDKENNENTSCTNTPTNSSFTIIPRIENVYSLQTVNASPENNDNQLGSKTNSQTAKVKRKSTENLCPIQSKIRIPSNDRAETQIAPTIAKTQSFSKENNNKSQKHDLDDQCGIPQFVLLKSNDSVQTLQVGEELVSMYNSDKFVSTQTVAAPVNTSSFFKVLPPTITNPAQIEILPQANSVQMLQNDTINCNNKIAPNIYLENGVISLVEPNVQTNLNNKQAIQNSPILFQSLKGSQTLADRNPGPQINAVNNLILPNTNLFHNQNFSNINSGNDVFITYTVPSIGECSILHPVHNKSVHQISQLCGKDLLETVGDSLDMVITTNCDNDNAIPNVAGSCGDNVETIEIDGNDFEDTSLVKDENDEDEADCILGI